MMGHCDSVSNVALCSDGHNCRQHILGILRSSKTHSRYGGKLVSPLGFF